MPELLLRAWVLLLLTTSVCAFVVDNTGPVITPSDPRFSDNACIIVEEYTVPDCSRLPPDRILPPDEAVNPCPGCFETSANTDAGTTVDLQTFYEQIEDALDNCPYDPVLIEFTGTLYLSNDPFFWYNQTKDLIIRGITETVVSGGANVTVLVPMNVTVFDPLLNTTVVVEQLVEQTTISPVVEQEFFSTIVGFKDMQVLHQNISITFEDVLLEGCETERPLFLTFIKPERCDFPDPLPFCCGAYFPTDIAEQIVFSGVCQRTAGAFDGYRAVVANGLTPIFDVDDDGDPDALLAWMHTEAVTVEMWVKPGFNSQIGAGVAGAFFDNDDDDDSGYGFQWMGTELNEEGDSVPKLAWRVGRGSTGNFDPSPLAPTPYNQWTHVAGVFDSGNLFLYVNGVLEDSETRVPADSLISWSRTRVFMMGVMNSGDDDGDERWYDGDLDEVRVWSVARTQSQIQSNMRRTITPTNQQLTGYWRFDLPKGAEVDLYEDNWVAYHQFRYEVQSTMYFKSGAPHMRVPDPIPACFCEEPDGLCVATNLQQEAPPDAISAALGETCNQDSDECQFVHGLAIDPNLDPETKECFGILWLPGLKEVTGPAFNQTMRFVPGRFVESFSLVPTFNTTTNTTTYEVVLDVEPRFVPGAVGSTLPPVGVAGGNPWWFFPIFIPGWFANNGMPPYTAMNFYPGVFFNITEATGTYGVPTPDGWAVGDLVFVPGLEIIPGFFVPYQQTDPLYIGPINMLGGFTFNFVNDTDECVIPAAPLPEEEQPPEDQPVLEDEFGCAVGPSDPEPQYLAPGERDPCFVLAQIRSSLPAGTEMLPAESVLGCTIGPNDPEPEYLDPSSRDPCFILRELRELAQNRTSFAENCTLAGGVPLPELFMPCLKNQNVSVVRTTVQNYFGERVLCQHACDELVTLVIDESWFRNIPGTAVWSSGLQHYDVHNNVFCPCGGFTDECVYLNANHITDGQFAVYNNRHCAIEDLLPIACDYDLTGVLRCQNGQLFCMNITETLIKDCQKVEISPGVVVFDSDCAVYSPCTCEPSTVNVTLANGQVVQQQLFAGSISIDIPFLTPILADITGGNTTLVLECPLRNETFTYTYLCTEEQVIQVPMDPPFQNLTMNVTITVTVNCTEERVFETSAGDGGLECPCPPGFDPDNPLANGTLVGSQIGSGIYAECEWDLPEDLGYQPGEVCVDGVVFCPYEGGLLGDSQPPPPMLGECAATGMALVECSALTCVGGLLAYEGVMHSCDLSSGLCASDGVLQIPCQCTTGYLTVTCDRSTCIPPLPCPQAGGGLCEFLDGTLTTTFDGAQYQCVLLVNETLCQPGTYVPSQPTPAPGNLVVPCFNNYQVPGPGPCSCVPSQDLGGSTNDSLVLPGDAPPPCDTLLDPNCTLAQDQPVNTGSSTLQLTCLANGMVRCRCDGINALQPSLPGNRTLNENACAFKIDNVPWYADLWFQQNNVAQQLPFGWCYERVDWELITRFPLKVLHFFTGEGVMHESARISPLVTGTVQDWRDGHPLQWNVRTCNDGCYQARPQQLSESCVVDQRYGPETPDFEVLRFDRIQKAHDDCPLSSVVVHKSENVYEERLNIYRNDFWLGSYDNAVVVQSGLKIRGNNITIRGFHFIHPNTDKRPIFSPVGKAELFDTSDDDDEGESPPANFTMMNNLFSGDGVNDAGALVGPLGVFFKMFYNTFENFFTRTIDIQATSVEVELNTWKLCTGRAFRGRLMHEYRFEENLLEECVGVSAANDMDIVSLQAFGDMGKITPQDSFSILFAQLFGQRLDDDVFKEIEVNPKRGCNENNGLFCYIRGNRQMVSVDQPDQSSILYRVIGGSIPWWNIRDNTGNHARVCMHISGNPNINILDKSELYKRNALCKTRGSRQVQDEAYDFGFQSPGSLTTFGCAFPDCLAANESYPEMEVNPRCDLNLVDEYGFVCINNITECARHSLELNLCKVTSGQARLRRERMVFWRNAYVQGAEDDFPCCDKPVIYEDKHLFAADRTILDYLEFRFEIENLLNEDGERLFTTLEQFNAQQLHMYRLCMDGRYTIGRNRLRIADLYMREEDGDFRMEDCRIYNWWHYPDGTQLGFVDDPRGAVPIVILPNGTIFFTERSPDVDGFYVYFTPHRRIRLSPFVVPKPVPPTQAQLIALDVGGAADDVRDVVITTNPRIQQQVPDPIDGELESVCVLLNNYVENLDGRVFTVISPANYVIVGNHQQDCGMRQFGEVSTFMVEGNPDSTGIYEMESNYIEQRKPFLWSAGGGTANNVRISCYEVHGFGSPRGWTFRNNTCILQEDQEDAEVVASAAELAQADIVDRNVFTTQNIVNPQGFNLFGLDEVDPNSIKPPDISVGQVVGTTLSPETSALGGYVPLSPTQSFTIQSLTEANNGRGVYSVLATSRGHTVGLRLYDIGADTIALTQTVGIINDTLFPFQQPGLMMLRILAAERNAIPSQELLANGTYTLDTLPTNWPWGLNGLQADIIYCGQFSDILDATFDECAVCNDGCPVIPPDECIVDPSDGTFVPENPFFGRWVFTSINNAVLHCVDPDRDIMIVRQATPYTQAVNVQASNWKLFSQDGAQISVQTSPVQLNAHNITFAGLTFLHRAGSATPTVRNGNALGVPPQFITFQNCTFDGQNLTQTAAIQGGFDTLAIEDCAFRGYLGPRVVDVTSACGAVFVENSHFQDATGSALYLREFDEAVVRRNTFDRCGGGQADELSCVYLRMCVDSMVRLVFSGNEHTQDFSGARFEDDDNFYLQTGTHCAPNEGYTAAYWLDGLPVNNVNLSRRAFDLSGNRASGLPVGLRATRMDDLTSTVSQEFATMSKRANVQYLYITHRNLFVSGTWHHVVIGDPCDDHQIDADPEGFKQFYCDQGCSGSAQNISLIVSLSAVVFGLFLYFVFTYYYRIARAPNGMRQSDGLDMMIPRRPGEQKAFASFKGKEREEIRRRDRAEERRNNAADDPESFLDFLKPTDGADIL